MFFSSFFIVLFFSNLLMHASLADLLYFMLFAVFLAFLSWLSLTFRTIFYDNSQLENDRKLRILFVSRVVRFLLSREAAVRRIRFLTAQKYLLDELVLLVLSNSYKTNVDKRFVLSMRLAALRRLYYIYEFQRIGSPGSVGNKSAT